MENLFSQQVLALVLITRVKIQTQIFSKTNLVKILVTNQIKAKAFKVMDFNSNPPKIKQAGKQTQIKAFLDFLNNSLKLNLHKVEVDF